MKCCRGKRLNESFETDGNGSRYTLSRTEFASTGGVAADFFTRTDGSLPATDTPAPFTSPASSSTAATGPRREEELQHQLRLMQQELDIARSDHPSYPCLNATAGFACGSWFELGNEGAQLDLVFGEIMNHQTSGLLLIEQEGGRGQRMGPPEWRTSKPG